jgi:hypothetical protein
MPALLKGSSYDPRRGGHAPGDVRDAFIEAIDAYQGWRTGPEPTVELREQQVTISQLCGLLWNCQDTLPSHEYDVIRGMADTPPAGSYGGTARWMKAEIARRDGENSA